MKFFSMFFFVLFFGSLACLKATSVSSQENSLDRCEVAHEWVMEKNAYGQTRLYQAVDDKDLVSCFYFVRELTRKDVMEPDHFNQTALHLAASNCEIVFLQLLYIFGGLKHQDFMRQDDLGRTILHFAVIGRDTKVIQYVIETGGLSYNDIQKPDNNGDTALDYAEDSEEIKALLQVYLKKLKK